MRLVILAVCCFLFLNHPAKAASTVVRIMIPNFTTAPELDREFGQIIGDYNRTHPKESAQLIRRGEDLSSLREFMSLHLAGDPPDLALVEAAEIPAVQASGATIPIPPERSPIQTLSRLPAKSLPFQRALPLLVADQEILFRAHVNPNALPKTWAELIALARKLEKTSSADTSPASPAFSTLTIPLQGSRGLWIFEAIADRALWTRNQDHLQSNPSLATTLEQLQSLSQQPRLVQTSRGWESSLQAFIERKSPLLIASSDVLPYLTRQAAFRWTSSPLPAMRTGNPARIEIGSDWVVTQDRPEVWKLLQYLYSPEISARWKKAGGFVPGQSQRRALGRSTDSEIVRARAEWIQALRLALGDNGSRLSPQATLKLLDTRFEKFGSEH